MDRPKPFSMGPLSEADRQKIDEAWEFDEQDMEDLLRDLGLGNPAINRGRNRQDAFYSAVAKVIVRGTMPGHARPIELAMEPTDIAARERYHAEKNQMHGTPRYSDAKVKFRESRVKPTYRGDNIRRNA